MTTSLFSARVHCKDRYDAALVRGRFGLCRAAIFLLLAVYMTGSVAAAQRTPSLDDRALTEEVEAYFASQPGYQKGDLITRSQIEKALIQVQSAGIKVPEAGAIAKLGLADDSFIVRELSTAEGRRFMRKIARDSGTYSRLDRLSTIPRGQTTVHDLVRLKDGDKMIEYMATTKGGKNMGSSLAGARGGVDLNKPTGRIYTADDLVAAIKTSITKP